MLTGVYCRCFLFVFSSSCVLIFHRVYAHSHFYVRARFIESFWLDKTYFICANGNKHGMAVPEQTFSQSVWQMLAYGRWNWAFYIHMYGVHGVFKKIAYDFYLESHDAMATTKLEANQKKNTKRMKIRSNHILQCWFCSCPGRCHYLHLCNFLMCSVCTIPSAIFEQMALYILIYLKLNNIFKRGNDIPVLNTK